MKAGERPRKLHVAEGARRHAKPAARAESRVKALGMLKERQKQFSPLPSWCSLLGEPLGLVTCEAIYGTRAGRASGGLTETIEDGVTGLLLILESGQFVSDVIVMGPCLRKRAEMGRAGRRWRRKSGH